MCGGVGLGDLGGGGCAASASAPMTSPEFKVGRASPSEVEEREEEGSIGGSSHQHLTASPARRSVATH